MNQTIDKTPEQIAYTERLDTVSDDIARLRFDAANLMGQLTVLQALFNPEAEPAKDVG